MKFLYWLRAQWWKLSFWSRNHMWWVVAPVLMLCLVCCVLWIRRELQVRAFVAEAQRVMQEMEDKPKLHQIQIMYAGDSLASLVLGYNCAVTDGWLTFEAIEDPKGLAFISPAITDWAVCTPIEDVVPLDPFHFHPQIQPETEPHSLDEIGL